MHPQELGVIVQLHAQWLATAGTEGRRAELDDADLRQADLRNADLSYASLAGANMIRAELAGANLRNADGRGADLSYANMSGADLGNANLERANLTGAELTRATLRDAILWSARLDFARLGHADLTGTRARGAIFRRADLSNANMAGAEFSGSDLGNANLTSAVTTGIRLEGAILAGALFTSDQAELLTSVQTVEDMAVKLPRDERITRTRLLRLVAGVQAVASLTATVTLLACLVAVAVDGYAFASTRSASSVSGFDYLVALGVIFGTAAVAVAGSMLRLRVLEQGRKQGQDYIRALDALRAPAAPAAAPQQED